MKATAETSTAATSSTAETTSAASALAAADPTPSSTSYLPSEQIVAGVAYTLGRQQLVDAQTELNAATWGSGNIAGGLAAIVPQLFLSSAAATLDLWSATNSGAQGFFAATANIPIVHQIAGGNLLVNILLPSVAGAEMNAAAFFLPLVSLFTGGGSMAPVSNSLSAATSNTRVYGIVPVTMKATTEPVVYISVNGGPSVPVLVDTGSSGLVISYNAVNQTGLGTPTGSGSITYSGAPTEAYDYNIYTTTVDFGNGIVSEPTSVDVVTQADSAAFESFLSWGAEGILGIGANAAGPGPSIPTTSLPGELSDGVLLYQGLFFGLGGLMIFGQNPMPVRVSVPGTPDAWVQVQVNNGTKTTVGAIIDSGGVYGTILQSIVGSSSVPAGTKISVYTADGSTLLYSFITTSFGSPTVISTGLINTGYYAFQQGPVYINYAYDNPYGIGSTDFNYA
ncbi:PecA family PE domain-processing aspartic protease [Mycobacterium sp. M26]|uniref:PecA family PE domain-processing aspartic protease n=1 Tax=Mycobacterium sp. M26 TaxID=1762962 RepID=UPI00073E158D|nr:PecA family PE domain-processing aspartic protease [Mycobacterium sp. M26]